MQPFNEIEFLKQNNALIKGNEKIRVKYCENILYLLLNIPCNFETIVRLLEMDNKRTQLSNALAHLLTHKLIYEKKIGTKEQHGCYYPKVAAEKYRKSLQEKIAAN